MTVIGTMLKDPQFVIEQAKSLIKSKDYPALVVLLEEHANTLIESNQKEIVLSFIDAVPDGIKYENDYLLWLGVNISPLYVTLASVYFTEQFERHIQTKNYHQAYRAWTGYANVKFHYLDRFTDMILWLKQADKLLDTVALTEQDDGYEHFCIAYFMALLFVRPDKNAIKIWVNKLNALLIRTQNPYLKTNIYNHLILYYVWTGDMHQARLLHKEGLGVVYTSKHSPFYLAMHSIVFSMVGWLNLDHKSTEELTQSGIVYANNIHINTWNVQIYVQNIYSHICHKEFDQAKKCLKKLEKFKDSAQLLDSIQYHYLTGWLKLNNAESLDEAHAHLKRALDLAKESKIVFIQAVIRICLAQVCFQQNKLPSAVSQLAQAQWIGRKMGSKHIRYGALLAQSYVMLVYDNKRLSSFYLNKALTLAKNEQYWVIPGWPHDVMQQLLEKALHEDIQSDFVRQLILVHNIQPTGHYTTHPNWPWHIHIHCLGEFAVLIRGKALEKNRKVQKKPIEFLQLLVWHGNKMAKANAAELLYPEEDADKALQALNTTIFRTRKMLNNKQAVVVEHEHCLLNSDLCHADIYELKGLLSQTVNSMNQESLSHHSLKIQRLWLQADMKKNFMDPPWLVHCKTQLIADVIKYLRLCGQRLTDDQQTIDTYQFILSLDETLEVSYQDLIVEYLHQDQMIEAKKTYLHCEAVFHQLFSAQPSFKTKQLISK